MKVFKQILRAAGFFGIYLLGQLTAFMLSSIICAFVAAIQLTMNGITDTALITEKQMEYYYDTVGLSLIASAILAIAVYLIIFAARKVNPLKQVDFKKVSGKDILFTVIGAVGAMFFMNLLINLIPFPVDSMEEFLEANSTFSSYPLWQAIIANIICAPILEEVVFRGLVYGRLRRAMPAIVAAIISSVLFGLMHGHWIWVIWAFFMGMIFNYARMRTGSILPGIIMHMVVNTFGVVCNYSTVFNGMTDTVGYILLIGGGIMLVVFFVGLGLVTKKEKAAGLITEPKLEDEDIKVDKSVSTVVM
jgi:membrane protease YdiL (CAAX protease family)